MARKNKKKGEKFIGIHGKMYKSQAFESLSPNAVRVFIELKWRYNGYNNGEIAFSIGQTQKLCKIGSDKAKIAIMELLHSGFIRIRKIGLFTTNMATEYELTCEKMGNNEPRNEWKYYPDNDGNKIRGKNLNEYHKNLDRYLAKKINSRKDLLSI